jgi:methionyl-tRNA formyltransferase
VPIPADATTPSLTATLAGVGATLLLEVLRDVEAGTAVAVAQPEEGVTLAPRLRREDGELEWPAVDAVALDRHLRALQPWPGVTVSLAGERVRLLAGAVEEASGGHGEPGAILRTEGESVVAAAADGAFRIDRVHPPGSRPMTAAAYLRGRRATS